MKISIFADDDMQLMHDEIPLARILLLVLTAMLLISEVSIISTLFTLLILTVQTLFGFSIIGWLFNKGSYSPASKLFLGFLFGTIFYVVFDQILRTSGYRHISLPFMVGLCLMINWRDRRQFWPGIRKSLARENDPNLFFLALLLVLIPLSQVWSWTINLVAVLLGAFLAAPYIRRWVNSGVLFAILAVLVVGASRLRPVYWWLPGWGIDEQDIFARAIFNWGPNGDVLLAGIPLKYQWFGYAWMGAMSNVTGASDFEFVSRTAYVICAVAAVLAVFAISVEITRSIRKAFATTIIVVGASSAISYPVAYSLLSINYLPIAMVLLLGWLLILLVWLKSPTLVNSIAIAMASVVCVSAKSVHIVAVVILPLAAAVYFAFKENRRYLLAGVANLVCCYTYTIFYFPSAQGSGLQRSFAEFTREFGVPPEVSSLSNRLAIVVMFFLSITAIPLVFLIFKNHARVLIPLKYSLFVYFVVASFLALAFRRVSATELHFIQIFVLVTMVLFASAATDVGQRYYSRTRVRVAALTSLCFITISFFLPIQPIADDVKYVVGVLRVVSVLATVIILVALIGAIHRSKKFKFNYVTRELSMIWIVVLLLSTNLFIVTTRHLRPINSVAATYQLGQANLREAAVWINKNTEMNSIVASNLFFGEDAPDYCEFEESYLMDSIVKEVQNSNYYTAVALVKRRFLVAGVLYASILYEPTSYDGNIKGRIDASLRPACYPDEISRKMLQENEVDIYLGYRNSIDDSANWNDLGQVLFQNRQYIVVDVE
jgi:hypothetical protein